LEEGRAFQAFIDQRGYSERRLAERIGKDRGYIQNRLALLRAPEDVQHLVSQRADTISAARVIAQLPTAHERRPLIEGIASGTLTHKDVLALVNSGTTAPDIVQANEAGAPARHAEERSTQDPSPKQAPTPLTRALDRDIPMLQAIFSRWRQALNKSRPEERERMLAYIDEHLEELENLTEALRSAS
jgi:ParB-like chromosome segregation protein Spo0J